MKLLRRKNFSIRDNWNGNPEFASALFGNWSNIKISDEVKEDLENAKYPINNDFAKLMQLEYQFAPGSNERRIGGQIQGCPFFMRGYEDLVKNIYDPNHTQFGTLKYEKPRVVIGRICTDDKDIIVSYLPDTKKYIITKEHSKYNVISRGVNKLFGGKKFELVLETADYRSVLNYIKGITIVRV